MGAAFLKAGDKLSSAFSRYPTKYVIVIACTIGVMVIALIMLLSLCLCCRPNRSKSVNIVVPTIESVEVMDKNDGMTNNENALGE
jgi:hypothetical protein